MTYKADIRGLPAILGGVAAMAAAVGELAGATTVFVRASLGAAAAGAAVGLLLGGRGAALLFGAAAAALVLHLWTYHGAPVGTAGLAADLAYWGALALGAALGAAQLVPRRR